jgi:sugar phosphate isomerase/epimerase
MQLAVHSTALLGFAFEDGLAFAEQLGITSVELACAGLFTDRRYGDPHKLLESQSALAKWQDAYKRHGLEICALSVHGEPLSPNRVVADRYLQEYRDACRLCERIGISRLALSAGLPEGADGDTMPYWAANLAPDWPGIPNPDVVSWQWEERVLPYWREQAQVAIDHGCQLCFEMMVWDMVYNPRTLLHLRDNVGDVVKCNFDPSHLFMQGIDVLEAVDFLANCIALVHAKDTRLNESVVRHNGFHDVHPADTACEATLELCHRWLWAR